MIVRILGEGQWEVPDSAIADLNALDDQVEQAVAQQDQAGLAQALGELLSEVRTIGTAVPDDQRDLMKGDPLRGVHAFYSASAREWWAPLRADRRVWRRNAMVAVLDKPSEFAERAVHGTADPATCAACHGVDGTGGAAGVACSRCHATYPHPTDQKTAHLAVVSQVGEPICLRCHAAGDGRFPIPAACGAVCHGSPP